MPKDCYTCFCYETEFNMCSLTGKRLDDIRLRQDDCPLIEIVTCRECKHKPIKYDPEGDDFGFNLVSPNGYDNLCPCLNTDDGFYSYMPEDNFFCAFGERRADENN